MAFVKSPAPPSLREWRLSASTHPTQLPHRRPTGSGENGRPWLRRIGGLWRGGKIRRREGAGRGGCR